MKKALAPNDRVRLHGLRARSELNGSVAVVLEPSSKAEADALRVKGRVRVTGFPKCLSIKPANLTLLPGPGDASVDWTWTDVDPVPGLKEKLNTVRGMMRTELKCFKSGLTGSRLDLGGIDRCDELTNELWHLVSRGPDGSILPLPPAIPLKRSGPGVDAPPFTEAVLNNTAVHALYYLKLDAVSHHLIIETNAGLGRVHQAFIKALTTDEDAGVDAPQMVLQGYTAREWATPPAQPPKDTPFDGAHRRWGSGQDLTRAQLGEFVETIMQLQDVSMAVAREMERQLPAKVIESDAELLRCARAASGTVVKRSSLRAEWMNLLKENPHWCTLVDVPNHGAVLQSHPVHFPRSAGWGPFSFEVPEKLWAELCAWHCELTGCWPNATTLVSILGCGSDWSQLMSVHEGTGGPQAFGWAYMAGLIPH